MELNGQKIIGTPDEIIVKLERFGIGNETKHTIMDSRMIESDGMGGINHLQPLIDDVLYGSANCGFTFLFNYQKF